VFPTLGAKPIATITADDLLAVLIPLAERVPETAKRVRERLAAVFADAALRGLCDGNPADLIRRALRRRKASPKHLRALPYVEVPALVSALQEFDRADPPAKLALEFAILTAARSGEVRGATWSEIDLEAAAWTVPATRMKGHRPHFVPLTPRALAILEEVRAYSDGKPTTLVFRGRDLKRPLSDMTLTGILRRMPVTEDGPELWSERTTVHGFRSAFSTWARERTRVRVDVIEAALAHREQDRVAAAYSRADYIRDRRSLAAEWEKFVAGRSSARVIKMPEARPAR
jgi:integrase